MERNKKETGEIENWETGNRTQNFLIDEKVCGTRKEKKKKRLKSNRQCKMRWEDTRKGRMK